MAYIYVIPKSKLVAFQMIYGLNPDYIYEIEDYSLNYQQIKGKVDRFVRIASSSINTYKVISFGHADEIAPMFILAPINVILPKKWKKLLPHVDGRKFY